MKKHRKPRTTGSDMCSCGLLNCDSSHSFLNTPYIRKLNYRQKNKLCIGCGNKGCTCKSSRLAKDPSKKVRKSFKTIWVNGKEYSYAICLRKEIVVVYDDKDKKHEIPFSTPIPEKPKDRIPTWKGKYGTGGYGVWEASEYIKAKFQ